jgi:hypothetical protein
MWVVWVELVIPAVADPVDHWDILAARDTLAVRDILAALVAWDILVQLDILDREDTLEVQDTRAVKVQLVPLEIKASKDIPDHKATPDTWVPPVL